MKKIIEKINNLSVKKILIISISISIIVFVVMSIVCARLLDLFSGICIGIILGMAVQLLISECICNYSEKKSLEKAKKHVKKTLKEDRYTEVHLRISNEYIDEGNVRFYAKIQDERVELLICKGNETKCKYLEFYEFNRIFSAVFKEPLSTIL